MITGGRHCQIQTALPSQLYWIILRSSPAVGILFSESSGRNADLDVPMITFN